MAAPRFSPDGKWIRFLVVDDRSVYPARASLSGGKVERLMSPPIVISNLNSAGGRTVVLSGGNAKATEIYVVDGNKLAPAHHAERRIVC